MGVAIMKLFVFRLLWISLERPCRFLSHGSLAFRFPAPATVGVIFHKEFELCTQPLEDKWCHCLDGCPFQVVLLSSNRKELRLD